MAGDTDMQKADGTTAAPAVAEQLSALLDDALPAEEVPLLLARCGANGAGGAARGTLARYALIGEALRGSAEPRALVVADRVRTAVDQPGSVAAVVPRTLPGWLMPAAGVAASVIFAVAVAATLGAGARAPVVAPVAMAARPALDTGQITDYLVYHGEYSGLLSAKLVDSHIVAQRVAAWRTEAPAP
ncbi:MAG: hypothetical protein JNM50_11580 [Chromatiales bacterium]|nr:hypothetical protein [Chromatiales bacterium]